MYTFESFASDTICNADFMRLVEFVESEQTDSPAFGNMGWNNSAGLLYNIHNKLRWTTTQGRIYIAIHETRIVAVSCIELVGTWSIGGIRTWITKDHRSSHLPSKILDQQVQWAYTNNCNFLLLTFNNYNQAIHTAVAANTKHRVAAGWSDWWDDCVAVPDQIIIRYTAQWAVIKPVLCSDNTANLTELLSWVANCDK